MGSRSLPHYSLLITLHPLGPLAGGAGGASGAYCATAFSNSLKSEPLSHSYGTWYAGS